MIETNFKMTEVGEIPKDWEVKSIDSFCKTSSGGTPYRGNVNYYNGTIRWFTTGELKDCTLYDSIEHISEDGLLSSSCKIFPANTLLMAMYGATIGRLGILQLPSATNQACCAIIPNFFCDTKYLFYRLLNNRPYIISLGSGAGQPNISQQIIQSLQLAIPTSLSEQRRIAEVLSDMDALIDSLDKLIAKKQAIKQGTMQQLLTGKTRLAGFTEPLIQCSLYQIMSIKKGIQLNGSELKDAGMYPMQNGGISFSGYTDCFNTEGHTITISEGGESCGFVNFITQRFWCGGHCYKVTPSSKVNNDYLYHLLKSNETRIKKLRAGSGLPNIQVSSLQDFEISYHSDPAEQQAIATILSDMDSEITALEAKKAKYEAIKQGAMQQLLTGRIRLI